MPEKFLVYKDKKIFYQIKKHKRARKIKVAVHNTGEVVVTVPFFISRKKGEDFLKTKIAWICQRVPENNQASKLRRQSQKDYLVQKEKARSLITSKVEQFNQFYKLPVKKIFIRNQKTRWGSCSSQGNLNFNYKLINLPEKLSDYIVVHELCHLKELNHSQKFWQLVSQTIPDYKERRRILRNWKSFDTLLNCSIVPLLINIISFFL